MFKPNSYKYESLGDLLDFTEAQGWEEPYVDYDRTDAADCLEIDAIEYLLSKGWEVIQLGDGNYILT
jgi:hypothetical protein|tara:strand:+ start:37 stop:237 length:201 start_codon:yes stop_codon:yes gene_type:complete